MYHDMPINLFVRSNITALLAWITLFLPVFNALIALVFCFIYLLFIDRTLARLGVHADWFATLRWRISIFVILSLCCFVVLRVYPYIMIMV